MKKILGQFNPDKGEGQLRPLTFPQLMLMDTWTGDDRMFESAGGGSRNLPLSIMAQTVTARGHDGAVAVGSLQEVTFHDDGLVSGRGWLADTPFVREQLMPLLASQSLRHNSVDLADATVILEWKSDDPTSADFWEYTLRFPTWNLAATTILSVPAFPDARVLLEDELVASMCAEDTELSIVFDEISVTVGGRSMEELTASMTVTEVDVSWDDFHTPENPDRPTPICVDADGRVFGNLADWETPHASTGEFCPRPGSYDNFHKANSILTDRGPVATGPIFFLGGHPDNPIGNGDPNQAYGGVENAWADVVVTNGRWGPWISGHVRPGLSAEALYVARASKISGHWSRDRSKLLAIVSVNQGAYHVPNSKLSFEHNSVAYDDDGSVLELVASLHTPRLSPEAQAGEVVAVSSETSIGTITLSTTSDPRIVMRDGQIDATAIGQAIADRLQGSTANQTTVEPTVTEEITIDVDLADEEAERLGIELDLDDLDDELAIDTV